MEARAEREALRGDLTRVLSERGALDDMRRTLSQAAGKRRPALAPVGAPGVRVGR